MTTKFVVVSRTNSLLFVTRWDNSTYKRLRGRDYGREATPDDDDRLNCRSSTSWI